MNYFLDVGLLLLFGASAFAFVDIDLFMVLAFLTAFIIVSLNYYIDNKIFIVAITLIFMMLSLLSPVFLYVIPVLIYAIVRKELYILLVPIICLLFYQASFGLHMSLLQCFLHCFGVFLAYVLGRRAEQHEKLTEELKRSRDDSTEHNLLLAEKNRFLLKNQDQEIYNATLTERNRIAREIHDNVGHMLTRSILIMGALKAVNRNAAVNDSLTVLDHTLNSAMNTIRSSVHDLHDEAINLEAAMQKLVQEFAYCPVSLQYDMGYDVPKEIKYSFISITKEALSNVIKHSNASQVYIILREHPGLYQLCIEDNGSKIYEGAPGIGLVNMKERIQGLKGNIKILTDEGFKIFITIPKEISN